MRTLILTITLCAIVCGASAQLDRDSTYRMIQNARNRVAQVLSGPHYTQADINWGIAVLDSIYRLVDTVSIKTTAYDDFEIKFRLCDMFRDMGEIYAMGHHLDSAMYFLRKSNRIASFGSTVPEVFTDSTEKDLWTYFPFLELAGKIRRYARLMHDSAFQTPYVADLPYEQKVAGLTLLWSQAKYNFVNFDHVNIDWDQQYMDYLPKIKSTANTKEYYKVLMQFYASLKDGHTNVYVPDTLSRQFYAKPPLWTALIGGHVLVTDDRSDSLEKTGIVAGLEIVKIDGVPVLEYAKKNVEPYESSSTPQDMEVRKFTYGLLAGAADSPVTLTFKDKNGKTWDRTIARKGYRNLKPWKTYEWRVIGNIGYLALNDFEHYKLVHVVDSLFPAIEKTSGLVIDIRMNGGGSSNIGWAILSMLTDKSSPTAVSWNRENYSTAWSEIIWHWLGKSSIEPSGKHFYNKPVALLIGPETFSAAEDFTVAFELMHRGPLVGRSTGGSTGQPLFFLLPGGGSARVCSKRDTYPDGSEFIGTGVHPTVSVEPTISDFRAGTDVALLKAIELVSPKTTAAK